MKYFMKFIVRNNKKTIIINKYMDINILVIGSGGREHTVVKKLADTEIKKVKIFCIGPNRNPGIVPYVTIYVLPK